MKHASGNHCLKKIVSLFINVYNYFHKKSKKNLKEQGSLDIHRRYDSILRKIMSHEKKRISESLAGSHAYNPIRDSRQESRLKSQIGLYA